MRSLSLLAKFFISAKPRILISGVHSQRHKGVFEKATCMRSRLQVSYVPEEEAEEKLKEEKGQSRKLSTPTAMDTAEHNPAANTGTAAPDSELLDSRHKMVRRVQDLAMSPDEVPVDPRKRAEEEEGKSRLSGRTAVGRRVLRQPVASEAATTSLRGSPFVRLEQVALRLAAEEDTATVGRER